MKNKSTLIILSLLLGLVFFSFSHASNKLPAFFTQKIESTPNICQTCYPKIIKWGGKPHCAPAAVSNSLIWLSQNGFPSLQPFKSQQRLEDQAQLVNHLGEVMRTSKNEGTSPFAVLTGIKKYLQERKVPYQSMTAEGWRRVPDFVHAKSETADLDWIKEGTLRKSSIWILIGWYKYDPIHDTYQIFDGHWMTVVGYGKNRRGEEDANILIVHDPAERAERKNYFPKIIPLQHETIIDEKAHSSRSALGALTLSGDVVLKPSADFGIIQGAYRLEL